MTASGTSLVSVCEKPSVVDSRKATEHSTLCNSSKFVPSSVNRYVRIHPVVHDRGAMNVSCAVPTTRWSSPPFAANGTTAMEKADSFSSRGMVLTVLACGADGEFLRQSSSRNTHVDGVDDTYA